MGKVSYQLHLKGYVGGWDFDADYVDYILEKYKGEQVNVIIDSTGGLASSALSISAAFQRHGDVHVHYVGMNASAATIASLGAKSVTIDANALFLVHRASFSVDIWRNMNEEDMQELIEDIEHSRVSLQKLDKTIAAGYARRTGKSAEEIAKLMAEDQWLTAQEALEWGFVHEITDYEEDAAPQLPAAMAIAFAEEGLPVPPGLEEKKKSRIRTFFEGLFANTVSSNINTQMENLEQPQEVVEQPQAVETPTAEETLRAELAEAREALTKAEARIAELEKEPGDVDTKVIENATEKAFAKSEFCDSLKSAQELFNSIP